LPGGAPGNGLPQGRPYSYQGGVPAACAAVSVGHGTRKREARAGSTARSA